MWARLDLSNLGEVVWWAGIDQAPVWLDLARDFTEDWTHQQQIRDAAHRLGLTAAEFIDPVLDTFLRALPHTYRDVPAVPGGNVWVTLVDGSRDRNWPLVADPTQGGPYNPVCPDQS